MFIKTLNKQLSGTFYERVEDSRKGWLDKLTSHVERDDANIEPFIREDMQVNLKVDCSDWGPDSTDYFFWSMKEYHLNSLI